MSAYSESLFDTSFANSSVADISSSEAELRPVYMGELPEFYVVEEGDTLWGISYFFNIEMEVLAELNHLSESDIHRLGVGQKIRLKGEPAQANLSMQIRLVDAVGMPIKRPRVKVFADAEWSEYVGDIEGYLPPLIIEKPQYGLHIDFYNIAQKWETVHQSEALPWGVFDLTLFSGDVLVEVPLLPLAGVQQNTAAAVKAHIKNHQQQAAAQAKQETPALKSKHAEAPAPKPQTPVRVDTRVEQGKPSVDIAFKNVEGGLALYGPYNENYRPLILEAAKKHKLAPWLVAALIQVECHKEMKPVSSTLKNGEKKTSLMEQWHNLCGNLKGDAAQGLCQCMGPAWMDIAVNPNSALHAKLLQMYQIKGLQLGFRKKKDAPGSGEITQDKQKSTDGSKYLFSENGKEIPREEFLALRGDEALSIDGGCIYGLNLLTTALKKDTDFKKRYDGLNEHEKHMVHYAFHNQGPSVAVFLKTAWRWVDWNERRIKGEGKNVSAGHIFEKLCAMGQYKDTPTLLVTKILSVMFTPEVFTHDPDKYPKSTPANLLRKLWDGVVVTEAEQGYGKQVDAAALLEEIAKRPAMPAVKVGLGVQSGQSAQSVQVAQVVKVPQVGQGAQDVKVPQAGQVGQGSQGMNIFIGLKQRFAAWWSTEQQTTNPNEKKAVESVKPAPVVEQKKPVPETQTSKKTEPVKAVAEKPVTKKAESKTEEKVSAPKSVGKDPWSDKPWHLPLDVMEIRKRAPGQKQDLPLMKSAFGWYRTIEITNEPKEPKKRTEPKQHGGIDFAAALGSPVYNVFDGEFVSITTQKDLNDKIVGFGHYIVVLHQTKDLPSQQRKYLEALNIKSFRTFYAHLMFPTVHKQSPELKPGVFIKAGKLMALSGSSGNADNMRDILNGSHLHFEARVGKEGKEVFDPLPLFKPALIKDACRIYINKHLEDPQKNKPFECDKKGCSRCSHDVFKELKRLEKPIYSINDALYL